MNLTTLQDAARILDLELPMDDPSSVPVTYGDREAAPKSEAREARDAERAEAKERREGQEHVRDLSEPARKNYLDRGRGTRPSQQLAGAVAEDGFSFTVHRVSNPDRPEHCKFCSERLLTPREAYPCEMDAPMGETFTDVGFNGVLRPDENSKRSCACNGCARRQMGDRRPGGQPVQCGRPSCKASLRREQNKRAAERKKVEHRKLASRIILEDPKMTDHEIGSRLDIPKIRATEARRELVPSS